MLKVYLDLMSQPCRALYIFLKHTKIPHAVVPVALRKGEHLSDEYIKINPFKQVPAIEHDGLKLNESLAIFGYLCDKFQVDDSLYPKDLVARAKVDAFTHWQHLNLRLAGAGIFLNTVVNPRMGSEADPRIIAHSTKVLKASLKKLENIFLKDTPFVYSHHMTIADLVGVCELMQPKLGVGVDVTTDYPKVDQWIQGVRKTVGGELFDEAHQFISRAGEFVKNNNIPAPKL